MRFIDAKQVHQLLDYPSLVDALAESEPIRNDLLKCHEGRTLKLVVAKAVQPPRDEKLSLTRDPLGRPVD